MSEKISYTNSDFGHLLFKKVEIKIGNDKVAKYKYCKQCSKMVVKDYTSWSKTQLDGSKICICKDKV
jgi:hypothetical protein